ncbi:MAG: glycosyltransferase family 2 protein [Lewinellaceae bacterium]|nr:glycosyltransferase family 2 protein [Phaeodactylibacter sp.]MCB9036172.1 glycosyltransferase family 2 protein [Lewinellaceae bacterium]
MDQPLVSIIAVNYKNAEVTCEMLDTLRQATYPALEVLLVDNGAEERQKALFERHYPGLAYMYSADNLGFAGGNNLAIPKARGKYIMLLNNDTIVPQDFVEPMVQYMEEHITVGIASPKIYYHSQPNVLQYAGSQAVSCFTGRGRNLARLKVDDGRFNQSGPTGLAHGACMLIRREAIDQVGLLSERYFMYYEEIDFCERARSQGWDIHLVADSCIFHRESSSIGKNSPRKTYYLYRNRWLFMRLCKPGWGYYLFLLYFLLIAVPRHLSKHWMQQETGHARAILRSLAWNIRNHQTL